MYRISIGWKHDGTIPNIEVNSIKQLCRMLSSIRRTLLKQEKLEILIPNRSICLDTFNQEQIVMRSLEGWQSGITVKVKRYD